MVWLAEEIGLPYERHDVGGAYGFSDAYLAMNPNRLVPTIEDDGLVLWESNAILRYLGARYSAGHLWAADPAERAIGDKWMDWVFSFAEAQRDAFLGLVRRPPAERDADAIARSAEAAGRMMMRVETALETHSWLSGDRFGIGDIPMGVYAHTFFKLDIERPSLPRVEAWYRRLTTRPGYTANVMIPLT